MAKKKTKGTSSKSTKYNLINELHEGLLKATEVTRSGTVRLKRTELKALIENAFTTAAKRAAQGERVRFPVIGALVRKEVAAKKGGLKTTNPFTGEPMITKARPETKKPRWSFPKALKETFANKKHW
jgi:nucleoid DNA-binding protein